MRRVLELEVFHLWGTLSYYGCIYLLMGLILTALDRTIVIGSSKDRGTSGPRSHLDSKQLYFFNTAKESIAGLGVDRMQHYCSLCGIEKTLIALR